MSKTKKGEVVQLAMVGCGGMAGAHLRGYEELLEKGETRFRIVAAVDEGARARRGFCCAHQRGSLAGGR